MILKIRSENVRKTGRILNFMNEVKKSKEMKTIALLRNREKETFVIKVVNR